MIEAWWVISISIICLAESSITFFQKKNILGVKFTDAYESPYSWTDIKRFYYTKDQGLIAIKDKDNHMWVRKI